MGVGPTLKRVGSTAFWFAGVTRRRYVPRLPGSTGSLWKPRGSRASLMPGCRMRGGPAGRTTCECFVTGPGTGHRRRRRCSPRLLRLKSRVDTRQAQARADARSILEDAEREVETKRREADLAAKESSLKIKGDAEAEVRARRAEIARVEERLDNRDTALDRREGELDERRRRLTETEEAMRRKEEQLREREADHLRMLEEISSLTREEAERRLFSELESEL